MSSQPHSVTSGQQRAEAHKTRKIPKITAKQSCKNGDCGDSQCLQTLISTSEITNQHKAAVQAVPRTDTKHEDDREDQTMETFNSNPKVARKLPADAVKTAYSESLNRS